MAPVSKKFFLVHVTEHAATCALVSPQENAYVVDALEGFFIEDLQAFRRGLDRFSSEIKGDMARAYIAIADQNIDFHYYTAEKVSQLKSIEQIADICEKSFNINLDDSQVNILSPKTGDPFVPGESNEKEILIASIKLSKVREWQNFFVEATVFPERFEMSLLGVLGMVLQDMALKPYDAPVMVLDVHDAFTYVFILHKSRLTSVKKLPTGIRDFLPYMKEHLGIADPRSAKKMLFANSFDFSDKGEGIADKLIAELKASTGMYEVEVGQTIGSFLLPNFPKDFDWLRTSIKKSLSIPYYDIDYDELLDNQGVSFGESVNVVDLDDYSLGLLSILGR